MEFSNEAEKIAENSDFQLAGYCFEADKESTRAPRVVRIGNSGPFNNYVDKLRGKGGQKMSVFVLVQGIKTVHARGVKYSSPSTYAIIGFPKNIA